MKVSRAILVLALACFVSSQPATAATWADLSRQGSRALSKGDLSSAESFYSQALSSMTPKDKATEGNELDVKLLLAETFRREKKFSEADKQLTEVEKAMSKVAANDPLLAMRYWKRRSAWQQDKGLIENAGQSERNSARVLERLLPPVCEDRNRLASTLLYDLIILKAWDSLAAELQELTSRRNDYGTVSPSVQKAIDHSFLHLDSLCRKLCDRGDLSGAMQVLLKISAYPSNAPLPSDLWTYWLDAYFAKKTALPDDQQVFQSLDNAEAIIKSNSRLSTRKGILLKINSAQLAILERSPAVSASMSMKQKTEELHKNLAEADALKQLSTTEKSQLYLRLRKIISARFLKEQFTQDTLQLCQDAAKITEWPPGTERHSHADETEFALCHCRARFDLAIVHVRQKALTAAESALMSISKDALRLCVGDEVYEGLARVHHRIGRQYFVRLHDIDKATKHLNCSREYVQKLSPNFDSYTERRDDIEKLTKQLEQTIPATTTNNQPNTEKSK